MKTAFALFFLSALYFCSFNLQAQDIEAKLSGNTSSQRFVIKDKNGNILFLLNGIGNMGVGTLSPLAKIEGRSDDYLVFPVHGVSSAVTGSGVKGWATATTGYGRGVQGQADADHGIGVLGTSTHTTGSGFGVLGSVDSPDAVGVRGSHPSNNYGELGTKDAGVVGHASGSNYAGIFEGPVKVTTSLGGSSTPASGGIYQDNIVYAWADISATGSIISSYGISSCTRNATGYYTVTWSKPLTGRAITVTAHMPPSNNVVSAYVRSVTSTSCGVEIVNSYPAPNDAEFSIVVIGRP